MKKTLEAFIDPVNIPKKYGGQLEFEFGDFPVLDPALSKIVEWEEGKEDFPHGPLFWVNESKGIKWEDGKGGEKIKAIAAGSIGEKQRHEEVCTVTRVLEPTAEALSTGLTEGEGLRATRPELLSVPTATNSINENMGTPIETYTSRTPVIPGETTPSSDSSIESSDVNVKVNDHEQLAVQDGKVIPATRPEPVNFVTASEGIQTLSLSEKSLSEQPGNLFNGTPTEQPQTDNANKQDPHIDAPPPAPAPVSASVEPGIRRASTVASSTAPHGLKEKLKEKVEIVKEKIKP